MLKCKLENIKICRKYPTEWRVSLIFPTALINKFSVPRLLVVSTCGTSQEYRPSSLNLVKMWFFEVSDIL